jgi:hypothetical protein
MSAADVKAALDGVNELRPALHERVRDVALNDSIKSFDKRRGILEMVVEALSEDGHLCRTGDGRSFYFSKIARQLFDLDQREFGFLLSTVSGLSPTEGEFRFVLSMLQAKASQLLPVDVHTLAHFDQSNGMLAVADCGPGVWTYQDHVWKRGFNGDDSLLFFTDTDARPFEPDFNAKRGEFEWFLSQIPFANHGALNIDDQCALYSVALFQLFFPRLRRTAVIPAFLGPQGSGKSTAMRLTGRLLLGPRFDVMGLRTDKEDAFIAALTNRLVCGLDNADSRIKWLEDGLATYATRQRYQLRRYYTTNEVVAYNPRAFVMISSRDPQFRRSDVAERLLPFHFEKLTAYRDENSIYSELENRRDKIMGVLLNKVAEIAELLLRVEAPTVPFRMADYAAFGWRIFKAKGKEDIWLTLLKKLEGAQAEFAGDGDALVEVLRIMLDKAKGKLGPIESGELFRRCSEIAAKTGISLSKTSGGFGLKLTNMQRVIELELDAKLTDERGHARRRIITIEKR